MRIFNLIKSKNRLLFLSLTLYLCIFENFNLVVDGTTATITDELSFCVKLQKCCFILEKERASELFSSTVGLLLKMFSREQIQSIESCKCGGKNLESVQKFVMQESKKSQSSDSQISENFGIQMQNAKFANLTLLRTLSLEGFQFVDYFCGKSAMIMSKRNQKIIAYDLAQSLFSEHAASRSSVQSLIEDFEICLRQIFDDVDKPLVPICDLQNLMFVLNNQTVIDRISSLLELRNRWFKSKQSPESPLFYAFSCIVWPVSVYLLNCMQEPPREPNYMQFISVRLATDLLSNFEVSLNQIEHNAEMCFFLNHRYRSIIIQFYLKYFRDIQSSTTFRSHEQIFLKLHNKSKEKKFKVLISEPTASFDYYRRIFLPVWHQSVYLFQREFQSKIIPEFHDFVSELKRNLWSTRIDNCNNFAIANNFIGEEQCTAHMLVDALMACEMLELSENQKCNIFNYTTFCVFFLELQNEFRLALIKMMNSNLNYPIEIRNAINRFLSFNWQEAEQQLKDNFLFFCDPLIISYTMRSKPKIKLTVDFLIFSSITIDVLAEDAALINQFNEISIKIKSFENDYSNIITIPYINCPTIDVITEQFFHFESLIDVLTRMLLPFTRLKLCNPRLIYFSDTIEDHLDSASILSSPLLRNYIPDFNEPFTNDVSERMANRKFSSLKNQLFSEVEIWMLQSSSHMCSVLYSCAFSRKIKPTFVEVFCDINLHECCVRAFFYFVTYTEATRFEVHTTETAFRYFMYKLEKLLEMVDFKGFVEHNLIIQKFSHSPYNSENSPIFCSDHKISSNPVNRKAS